MLGSSTFKFKIACLSDTVDKLLNSFGTHMKFRYNICKYAFSDTSEIATADWL